MFLHSKRSLILVWHTLSDLKDRLISSHNEKSILQTNELPLDGESDEESYCTDSLIEKYSRTHMHGESIALKKSEHKNYCIKDRI